MLIYKLPGLPKRVQPYHTSLLVSKISGMPSYTSEYYLRLSPPNSVSTARYPVERRGSGREWNVSQVLVVGSWRP